MGHLWAQTPSYGLFFIIFQHDYHYNIHKPFILIRALGRRVYHSNYAWDCRSLPSSIRIISALKRRVLWIFLKFVELCGHSQYSAELNQCLPIGGKRSLPNRVPDDHDFHGSYDHFENIFLPQNVFKPHTNRCHALKCHLWLEDIFTFLYHDAIFFRFGVRGPGPWKF